MQENEKEIMLSSMSIGSNVSIILTLFGTYAVYVLGFRDIRSALAVESTALLASSIAGVSIALMRRPKQKSKDENPQKPVP